MSTAAEAALAVEKAARGGRLLAEHRATGDWDVVTDDALERRGRPGRREEDCAHVHIEIDPTGRPASAPGAKVDAGKVPLYRGLFDYFPLALAAIAEVSQVGAEKYSWKGWQDVPDGRARYSDAMLRHLAAESFGLLDDGPGGTGKRHDAQVAWNALARLELALRDPT